MAITLNTSPEDFKSLFQQLRDELFKESERGCALVGAAFIDETLEQVLRNFFGEYEAKKKAYDKLFSTSMPLSSTFAKNHICYAIGLIPTYIYHDIESVRRIRNGFAHEFRSMTFDMPKVRSRVESLQLWEYANVDSYPEFDGSETHLRFILAMAYLCAWLHSHTKVKGWALSLNGISFSQSDMDSSHPPKATQVRSVRPAEI